MIGNRAWIAVITTSLMIAAVLLWLWPDEPRVALVLGGLPIPGLVAGVWARQQGLRPLHAVGIGIAGMAVAWIALRWSFENARLLPFGKVTPEQTLAGWVIWPSLALGLGVLGFAAAYAGTAVARFIARRRLQPK